jgi:hypothetical protein
MDVIHQSMDWKTALPALVGGLIVILGWPIAHWFSLKREVSAEKRKTRIAYMLEAYRTLEFAGNRPIGPDPEHVKNLERALADIQLLGTPAQVRLAVRFINDFSSYGTASFDPLLYDLRQSLRSELELEHIVDKLKFIRISGPEKKLEAPRP